MTMHRNNADGSYNVRGHGGARPGTGPKPTGRKKVNVYVTDAEEKAIRQFLQEMREIENFGKPSK